MLEYPKRCTMEEAVACVKSGGKARLKGKSESTWTAIRRTKSGKICYKYDSGALCYSGDFLGVWDYQITKPAPVAPADKTYTTAEAIAEIYATGCEMVGERNSTKFILNKDGDGDIMCNDGYGPLEYIPNVAWRKKSTEKAPITRTFCFDRSVDSYHDIGRHISAAAATLGDRFTVECTIKESA